MDKMMQDTYNTLLQLSDDKGMVEGYTQIQLAILMGMPDENKYGQRVRRAIDRLVEKGLVERAIPGGGQGKTTGLLVRARAPIDIPEVATQNIINTEPIAQVPVEIPQPTQSKVINEMLQVNHIIELVDKAYKYDRLVDLLKEFLG